MSRQQQEDSDRDMAVTYTSSSNYASPGQTLPSFRELLPPTPARRNRPHILFTFSLTLVITTFPLAFPRPRPKPRTRPPPRARRLQIEAGASSPSSIWSQSDSSPLRDLSSHHHERPMSAYASYDYDDASLARSGSRAGYTRENPYTSRPTAANTDDDRYRYSGTMHAYDPARYPASQQQPPPSSTTSSPYPASVSSTGSSTEYMTHSHHAMPSSNFGVIGMGAGDALDSRGKRRRGNLPKPVTDVLRAWFHEHLDHPYPTEEDKQVFMNQTGLSISQISNWFINARRRQLPALRNQLRNSDGEGHGHIRGASPLSDGDVSSMSSSPTRMRHR